MVIFEEYSGISQLLLKTPKSRFVVLEVVKLGFWK